MTDEFENRERVPAFNVPPATLYLVAAIIGIHLLLSVTTDATLGWVYGYFSFRPAIIAAILENPTFAGILHIPVTLCSHLFLHHDWTHMALNAGMLLAFGSLTERRFGIVRFLVLYFLAGWCGAAIEYLISPPFEDVILYGASAAVFGTMGAAMIVLLPRFGLRGILIMIGVLLGVNVVLGATPLGALFAGGEAEIAWVAHMAGFAVGMILALLYVVQGRTSGH
ncbi:MAG: hypothetical protein CMN55_05010 [Sneathiella sp.]|uniref:rhomboid family intramembrane serine protease n=1 Tax=Sneathiella sp. TaxID=1964365 RepID=UPI000C59DDC3|nr:rhomboid family intramembrane serine protease [Sneathiella sp.]MAL78459.1 hypothetical protein [Sneathiella sp.]